MTRFTHGLLILATACLAAGCRPQGPPAGQPPPASPAHADELAREAEAIRALKELGANAALDEQGRAKVLRLSGPKITDAELAHVAALTELRALYLEGTRPGNSIPVTVKPCREAVWLANRHRGASAPRT